MTAANRAVAGLFTTALLLGVLATCAAALADSQAELEEAAQVLLELRPDANWTQAYNTLVGAGPRSIEYVVNRLEKQRPARPDDLNVLLHTSLARLLARPGDRPELSVSCFETSLGLLHFDPKANGERLGIVVMNAPSLPRSWLDLYPADFDHSRAARVDVEADRLAVLRWWRARRNPGEHVVCARQLRPVANWLWPVLARRHADFWTYDTDVADVQLCSAPPPETALLSLETRDYNLVRAACIWLAESDVPGVQRELIERVADRSPIVAHNARFALERSPDERIREVIERYKKTTEPPDRPTDRRSVNAVDSKSYHGRWRASPEVIVSCGQQGGATHEVVQTGEWVRNRDRTGYLHGGQVWRHGDQATARRG